MTTEFDSLLDAKLDDLKDMPEFKVYPAGAFKVTMAGDAKKIGEHPAVEVTFTLVEVAELADPTATPPAVGDTCSVAFLLDNELGQGRLKEFLAPLREVFAPGDTTIRQVLEASKGAEITIVTKLRADKNDATKKYLQVESVTV